MIDHRSAKRPAPDKLLDDIADYVLDKEINSKEAFSTAYYCLLDSLACAFLALKVPACQKLLGPVVEGAVMENGARVPGTHYSLDPVQAAFNIGTLIRWLDFNDTWLAAEWGHPSDNLGCILSVSDYTCRLPTNNGKKPVLIHDVLLAMIKAYEIQGILALENSFNRIGLDHVILVRIASTAISTAMLGGSKQQIINALSNAWLDGGALRAYRHAPNTGVRKSWAAGDATSRGVRLALMALKNDMGYPSALTAKTWGLYDVYFKGRALSLPQTLDSYVIENILFKIAYPAEFHAQTAVEAAIQLHDEIKGSLDNIDHIIIETQEAGMRIIDKTGPLDNPADRDHCLQYMVAVPLLSGRLTVNDYDDEIAQDPRIDKLRNKMIVKEEPRFSRDYLNPNKRSIANAIQIFFKNGSNTGRIEIAYPIGHRRRRHEGIPLLLEKFKNSLNTRFNAAQSTKIYNFCEQPDRFKNESLGNFMTLLTTGLQ